MLERELADFGARIGIPNLAWGEGDALTLTFDDLGSLTLACPQSEDDASLRLASRAARRSPPRLLGVSSRRALDLSSALRPRGGDA